MLPFTIKITPLFLSLITSFGLLLHDTHMDKTLASAPVTGYVASHETSRRSEDHVHTETVSENLHRLNSTQARLNTRFTDEKKYLTPKRLYFNTTFDGAS